MNKPKRITTVVGFALYGIILWYIYNQITTYEYFSRTPKDLFDEDHEAIVEHLQRYPGMLYISPSGHSLFLLDDRGDLLAFTGPDFNKMNPEAINNWVEDKIAREKADES